MISVKIYEIPCPQLNGFLLAKVKIYPKELGLFSTFIVVSFLDFFHTEPLKKQEVAALKLQDIPIYGTPHIMTREPFKRGIYRWKFQKEVIATEEEKKLISFRIGGPIPENLEEEFCSIITMQSQKKEKVPCLEALKLPLYAHASPHYLTYKATFLWLKIKNKYPLDFFEEKLIRSQFHIFHSFCTVFGGKMLDSSLSHE